MALILQPWLIDKCWWFQFFICKEDITSISFQNRSLSRVMPCLQVYPLIPYPPMIPPDKGIYISYNYANLTRVCLLVNDIWTLSPIFWIPYGCINSEFTHNSSAFRQGKWGGRHFIRRWIGIGLLRISCGFPLTDSDFSGYDAKPSNTGPKIIGPLSS